jgi:hypothetical protein
MYFNTFDKEVQVKNQLTLCVQKWVIAKPQHLFECGHPVVFILKHLITYNSVSVVLTELYVIKCPQHLI